MSEHYTLRTYDKQNEAELLGAIARSAERMSSIKRSKERPSKAEMRAARRIWEALHSSFLRYIVHAFKHIVKSTTNFEGSGNRERKNLPYHSSSSTYFPALPFFAITVSPPSQLSRRKNIQRPKKAKQIKLQRISRRVVNVAYPRSFLIFQEAKKKRQKHILPERYHVKASLTPPP